MHFFVFLLWQRCCGDVTVRGYAPTAGCALCAGDCGVAAITHALRALLRQSRRHCTKGAG